MNNKFDESKLTAYVLGELSESEAREVEARIEASPELQKAVAEIRETVSFLKDEFSKEPAVILTEEQRERVIEKTGNPVRRFHQSWYFRVAGVAATATFLFVAINQWTEPMIPPVDRVPIVFPGDNEGRLEPNLTDKIEESSEVQKNSGTEKQDTYPGRRNESIDSTETKDLKTPVSNSQGSESSEKEDSADRIGTEAEESTSRNKPLPSSTAEEKGKSEADSRGKKQSSPDTLPMSQQKQKQTVGLDPAQFTQTSSRVLSEEFAVGRGVPAEVGGVIAPTAVVAGYRESRAPSKGYNPPLPPDRAPADIRMRDEEFNTEAYDRIVENPFIRVSQDPLSTFSIDVDTASYSNMRRFLNQRQLPPKDSIRIEELINYFNYDYEGPTDDRPFAVHLETASAPWKPDHQLVRIGLKGKTIPASQRKPGNLVFLLDVSGSMGSPNKLPLLKKAFRLLVDNLTENDRVAIVVYAGASGLVLPSVECTAKEKVTEALENLQAGGSTNGGQGIQLAYKTAEENFIRGGINRVILATDGDFNIGVTNQGDLTRLIEEKAKSGVFLTVLGFGMGNYKDSNLEKLADKGNGNYAYIDTLKEARKVLVEEIGSTLVTIAKDVKIQIEFNPNQVNAYRLIGYENRIMRHQDFNDDTKDAGEIGAGHTVTALYEVVPAGVEIDIPSVDPLKYQTTEKPASGTSNELMTVKLRFKQPDGDTSKLIEFPLRGSDQSFDKASDNFRFASSVASFGMLMRDSEFAGDSSYDEVIRIAESSLSKNASGYRTEFINLVKKARAIKDLDRLEE